MNTAPNYALAVAITRTGWSNHETARQINKAAQQAGHPGIAVDHTRVGRWIRRGEKPRPPVPELLAELLSQYLNTRFTPASLELLRRRSLHIALGEEDHAALLRQAAAVNVSATEYTCLIVRAVLRGQNAVGDRYAAEARK
ncbi:hypothetical protein ACFYOD_06460 [Streptomyces sp. NPDC006703]|uniref:hypothetical protein n=1 Tax=Streptomyces sp. NPDC006703 TaxID=3364759 RepID=UPI0036AB5875